MAIITLYKVDQCLTGEGCNIEGFCGLSVFPFYQIIYLPCFICGLVNDDKTLHGHCYTDTYKKHLKQFLIFSFFLVVLSIAQFNKALRTN